VAAVQVAAGIYLVATGGDQTTARILLLVGILYGVMALIAEWRERRR